jgi:hypothetical protein
MSTNLKIFALFVSIMFLTLIIELVRRRKLREDYSAIYLFIGLAILVLVLRFDLLVRLTKFLDAALPASILFLFGLLFLLLMSLQYAVKLSKLSNDVKNLAQKIALMDAKIESTKNEQ